MNLMRIGARVINLDQLQTATYCEDAHLAGGLASAPRRGPELRFVLDSVATFEGDEARRAWEVLKGLCEFGDAPAPPSIDDLNRMSSP